MADDEGAPKPLHQYKFRIDAFESRWTLHPDPTIDLAIMGVGELLEQMQRAGLQPFVISLSKTLIPSADDLAALGALEDIVMVGYPIGIWDSVNNLPVFRRGITATHPAYDYEGRPEFLIDSACFPGSSGSPVFLYNHGSYTSRKGQLVIGSTRVKLLGILYAGPVHTVEGAVQAQAIPTQHQMIAFSGIPTNLGFVLKSRLLFDFEPLIDEAMKSGAV